MKIFRFQIILFLVMCFIPKISPAFEEEALFGMTLTQMYDYTTQNEDKRGSLVVLKVERGTPAHRIGIQNGDIILMVDNIVTKKHDCRDIIDRCLLQTSATETTITLWRPEKKEKLEFILHR